MHIYKIGEIAYLIESNRFIREGKILRHSGDFYLFRFIGGGGTRVRADRLFPSEEAAQSALDRMRGRNPKAAALAFD